MALTARALVILLVLAAVRLPGQDPTSRPSNRLTGEKSPYLIQHAHNPVDWWPWCDEAFAEAERRGVPVFLSIGYSTCHWCHVMERESFEDAEIAALLNASFVCIKVDREERADIDAIYMKVIQALNGNGGWPATLLLLPDRRAFWGGTYLPPASLRSLVTQVQKLWKEDRASLVKNAGAILDYLLKAEVREQAKELPPRILLDRAAADMAGSYDEKNGGFGGAPKFPSFPGILFLLRSDDERAPEMVWQTLKSIAHGGIHDHVGGGLHRYAVDARWRVPHFEKMLYDQAQALEAYAELGRFCADPRAYGMAADVAACLLRDFRAPGGGFYSAFDADSEGREGLFYLWTRTEIEKALTGDELKVVLDRLEIRADGNVDASDEFGMRNILIVEHEFAQSAERLGMKVDEVMKHWRSARAKLFERRTKRVPPRRDDKIIAAWNGLAIGALAKAGRIMDRPDWVAAAAAAADFTATKLRLADGSLARRFIAGEAAHGAGLEDHAYLAMGLLDLFEAGGDKRFYDQALAEAESIAELHAPERGAFLDAPRAEDHVFSPRDAFDGDMPSANGIATLVMLRFHTLTGDKRWLELADSALKTFRAEMERYPSGFPVLLRALRMRLEPGLDIVLVGDPQRADTRAIADYLRTKNLPDAILLLLSPEQAAALEKGVPLVTGKTAGPEAAPRVYVCRNRSCQAPVTSLAELEKLLAAQPATEIEAEPKAEKP